MYAEEKSEGSSTILDRVAAGDREAVEECINRYGSIVWSMAKRVCSRIEDAEDVVQEIFLAVWKHAARYDPEKASEATFIAMIARRRLIDHLRTVYRQPQAETIDDQQLLGGLGEHGLNARLDAVRAAAFVKRLRPEQKELIWLNIYEGMSHGEIASIKRLPLGTVKTHLRRGLCRVRQMMVQGQSSPNRTVSTC